MSNPTEPNPAPALALPLRVVEGESNVCEVLTQIVDANGEVLVCNETYYPTAVAPDVQRAIVAAVNENAAMRKRLNAAETMLVETSGRLCEARASRDEAWAERDRLVAELAAAWEQVATLRVALAYVTGCDQCSDCGDRAEAALAATELKPMVREERG